MPEILGIEFNKETGSEFQSWYGIRPSSWLVGQMIRKISDHWSQALTSVGSSVGTMRQAQGALDALGALEAACEMAAKMDFSDRVDGETTEEAGEYAPAGLEESYG